ncbi:DUF2897 family protein [Aliivibrio sp. S4TY2]|uniref:DUF2897 family protein n=1 Tax=unclassified Aliivibrio TaxID=2645654 RepID=UPI002379DF9B|nr:MULTISPECIES: DUF2897 family protein [unclassified Aliivibrio]MDD9154844.1 DUF2897 family protein [Aliivibrio sp. S4TY2]MDD9158793.1 DUF2897 family protein [Aliivibrio sp. S4TY1]MDD9162847.1 DUF2897 family protein [Aliivibrio sp. S4MY2]MDD9166792.1 DUF2897 family protein [Aliivibrio sp. S4MY4]MDD9183924.1 DUF2897 family protein [Aliivibrio sp. S4MY3]
MEWLMNPWVIIVIVLSVVIGNLAALKATANMKFKHTKKTTTPQENEKEETKQKIHTKQETDDVQSDEKKDAQ